MFRAMLPAAFIGLLAAAPVQGATIYVPDDYPTIQGAITASVDGDTIIVKKGIYAEKIDFIGKAVTVRSESGPEATIIDGNRTGTVVTFENGEGRESILDGFTICNGESAYFGGGIFCSGASPTIVRNRIEDNRADHQGGGIHCTGDCSPLIEGNLFSGNSAEKKGGAICCLVSYPCIWGNVFTGNRAGGAVGGGGGGVCTDLSSKTVIAENTFRGNIANDGGAIACYASSPLIARNIIIGNFACEGGGIYCGDSSPLIVNSLICGNTTDLGGGSLENKEGGGIHCRSYSSPTILNSIIVGNRSEDDGGGVYSWLHSSPTITNTILFDNDAPVGPEIWIGDSSAPSSVTISFSDVSGGQASVYVAPGCTLAWGAGMIDADPLFVDSINGDFHLTWDSPCRGSGDSSAVIEPTDFEGDPRIAGGSVDMGADEFHTHLYCMGTLVPGAFVFGAVVPGEDVEIKIVGEPGTTPVTLALGSGIQSPPLATPYGHLYLIMPPVRTADLGAIPSTGIRVVPKTVPLSCPTGNSYPFQALVGPLGNPASVLTNLMVLAVVE